VCAIFSQRKKSFSVSDRWLWSSHVLDQHILLLIEKFPVEFLTVGGFIMNILVEIILVCILLHTFSDLCCMKVL
jgi:hypothetical protein